MHEERSGSEQQPPEHQSAWPASPEGSGSHIAPPDDDADQARHADAARASDEQASPAIPTNAPAAAGAAPVQPAGADPLQAAGADPLQAAQADIPSAGARPGADRPAAGGYEYPTMIYAPPGSYPPGAGEPGAQGGYGPAGYEAGGYGPGYGGGPGYPADYGYGPGGYAAGEYGPGGYGPGGYGPGGYGPGGYGPAAYGPGGYGPGGYGPGGYGPGGNYPPGGSGYGMPGAYGSDDIIGGYGPERPPRRGTRILTYVVIAALAAGVGAGTVLALNHNAGDSSSSSALPGTGQGAQPAIGSGGGKAGPNNSTTQAVTAKVSPGIVDIISHSQYQGGTLEGTGMILSPTGLVLTNNHVIEGTSSWTARIANTGQTYSVRVLGTDKSADIALLQLNNASGLKTVPIGDSSSVKVGEPVVALGNADGVDRKPSVVTGQITALNRSIRATDQGAGTTESLHQMLQTNAPIISGDSGGALANTQGKVIGMNTAANSTPGFAPNFGGGQGTSMGFAIPINRALVIARQIAGGQQSASVQIGLPAFLGVTVASDSSGPSQYASPQAQLKQLEKATAQNGFGGFGGGTGGSGSGGCITTNTQASIPRHIAQVHSGTLVSGVLCQTPVNSAGMTAGSVITSISGQVVTSPATLTKILSGFHPGGTVSVHWVSPNGQLHTSSLKLASGPAK